MSFHKDSFCGELLMEKKKNILFINKIYELIIILIKKDYPKIVPLYSQSEQAVKSDRNQYSLFYPINSF